MLSLDFLYLLYLFLIPVLGANLLGPHGHCKGFSDGEFVPNAEIKIKVFYSYGNSFKLVAKESGQYFMFDVNRSQIKNGVPLVKRNELRLSNFWRGSKREPECGFYALNKVFIFPNMSKDFFFESLNVCYVIDMSHDSGWMPQCPIPNIEARGSTRSEAHNRGMLKMWGIHLDMEIAFVTANFKRDGDYNTIMHQKNGINTDTYTNKKAFKHIRDFTLESKGPNGAFFYVMFQARNEEAIASEGMFYSLQPLKNLDFPANLIERDYRSISHWIGCPQNLCLEGNIDAIDHFDGKTVVYREYYSYHFSDQRSPPQVESIKVTVDSVVTIKKKCIIFREGEILWGQGSAEKKAFPRSYWFPELPETGVDGAFVFVSNQAVMFLIFGDHCYMYILDDLKKFETTQDYQSVTWKYITKKHTNFLWPGLWAAIDDVTIINQKIYFIAKDFNVVYNYNDIHKNYNNNSIATNRAHHYLHLSSDWNQETIFEFCKNEKSQFLNQLGIFDIFDFTSFKRGFDKHRNPGTIDEKVVNDEISRIKNQLALTTTSTSSFNSSVLETNSSTSATKSPKKKTMKIPVIIGISIAVLLVIAFVVVFIYVIITLRKNSKLAGKNLQKDNQLKKRRKRKVKPIGKKVEVVG